MKIQNAVIYGLIVALIAVSATAFVFVNKSVINGEQINTGYANQYGDIIVTKKVAYSELTTAGLNITNPVQNGDLIVSDIIVESGPLVMASGTIFKINVNNDDFGSTTVMADYVSTFTAGSVRSFASLGYSASTTKTFVLEDGAYLSALCTGAACKSSTAAGAAAEGYLNITMIFKKTSPQAYIYE